jgi:hypothetical protein
MTKLDELTITLGKMGEGEWELTLEHGDTVEATLTDVEVDENRGFQAEGRNEEAEFLVELTTGPQPGGPIRLRQRGMTEDDWDEVGELADANQLD